MLFFIITYFVKIDYQGNKKNVENVKRNATKNSLFRNGPAEKRAGERGITPSFPLTTVESCMQRAAISIDLALS